jgi:hypothetical protein
LAENPLLPNRRLKELLELMQRCQALDRRAPKRVAREALIAATAIHLESGDILCGTPADATAKAIAPAQNKNPRVTWSAIIEPEENVALPKAPRLALCAAMANGLRASGTGGVVLAFSEAGATELGLAETLAYAQHARVPFLLAVADVTNGGGTRANTINFAAVTKIATKLQFPIFPVDGEDAVAVYRVMQECALRARNGEGPAIIWGVLEATATGKLTRSTQPIARMEKYLSVRGLLPKRKGR